MIKEYRFSFKELGLLKGDIEKVLGFEDNSVPDPFPEIIDIALSQAPPHCNIRGGFRIFDSSECQIGENYLRIDDYIFYPSKIVLKQLKNADSFALFVATSGTEISEFSKKTADKGDHMLSYVLDIIGSVTVDKASEKLQEILENVINKNGLSISDSFSPGYCGWSVSEQQKLFALLPSNFCGITLSDSSLMLPIKSVSGIIGIGNKLVKKGYQCLWCNEKDCHYGNIKRKKKREKKQ